jgi:DNA topoisomerase I
MTKLLIVESPAKAKTIAKYLNDIPNQTERFVVTSSVGHVRDLPKSNKKAIDIEAGFAPHYEVSKGKEKVIAEIKPSERLSGIADKNEIAMFPDDIQVVKLAFEKFDK